MGACVQLAASKTTRVSARAERRGHGMSGELKRVAYVDDDDTVRAVAEVALVDLGGLEIAAFGSGAEALEGLCGSAPDLILLDQVMPGMDGFEVMRRLRAMAQFEHTPIVFLTGRAQAHDVETYMARGAAGVISKPFDPMTLSDCVRAIWSACAEQAD
jgi:two-component system, OmpR family, response regulator